MPDVWTPEWSNPVFSLEERDRRWKKVRDLMARDGIDLLVCLPCTNSHDRGQADARYLTQLGENSDETTVALGIDGEITAWHSRGGVWPSSSWFADIRPAPRGTGGRTIVNWVKEHPRYERSSIAICGLDSSFLAHVRAEEGEANWQSVDIITRELANATIVSGTPIIGEARWVKSPEEIDFLRRGTQVAETTMQAVLEHARVGARERDVFAEMLYANAEAGGSFQPMFGWISGPLGNTYHRLEQPSFRHFQAGDVLIIEIEGRWAGYVAQVDQTFSLGPAHSDLKDGFKLACEAFERTFETLRPGVTVRELARAASLTGLGGRAKSSLTMHGRGTGDDGPGFFGSPDTTGSPAAAMADLRVEEGCVFVLKPSVTVDGRQDYGRFGDVVAVTRNGAERLGTRRQQLYELV